MVSGNFVKDMRLEEVHTHPFCILRQSKLANHSRFGQSNAAMYVIIAYTVSFYRLKSVRCRWRLVLCYARAIIAPLILKEDTVFTSRNNKALM